DLVQHPERHRGRRRGRGDLGGPQRVAVEPRDVGRWQVTGRQDVLGEDAADGVGEDDLERGLERDGREACGQVLLDAPHRGGTLAAGSELSSTCRPATNCSSPAENSGPRAARSPGSWTTALR